MSNSDQAKQTTEQIARRRLLQMASYVPPALLGAMLLNRPAIAAAVPPGQCASGGLLISAPAGSCCPCLPAADTYNPKKCCKNHCDPAGCDAYVLANGYSGKTCKKVNNWCGYVPAGCNCCIGKKGFTCKNIGQVCK